MVTNALNNPEGGGIVVLVREAVACLQKFARSSTSLFCFMVLARGFLPSKPLPLTRQRKTIQQHIRMPKPPDSESRGGQKIGALINPLGTP